MMDMPDAEESLMARQHAASFALTMTFSGDRDQPVRPAISR
jgi:hypothetical protein